MNHAGASPSPSNAWRKSTVVRTLPTRTTNMTGLRSWTRGSSLRSDSMTAPRTIAGSKSGRALADADMRVPSRSGGEQQVLDDRAERQRRDEGQSADDH